jgi:hypothetical protein
VIDHEVCARAEDDDQIGLAERVVAHRQVCIRVVVRQNAAPLRGRVERDAGLLDKARISFQACDHNTPLPETMIGCLAWFIASTSAF